MKTCERCKKPFSPILSVEPYCPECRMSMEAESVNAESDSGGGGVLDMLGSMLSSIADALGGSSDSGSSSSDSSEIYDSGASYDSGGSDCGGSGSDE
jgi:hypothetical protein